MKLLNKENNLFKVIGILVMMTLVFYLFANVMLYKNARDFAKKYGATEIKIEFVQNPDYKKMNTDSTNLGGSENNHSDYPQNYVDSIFRFYKDGVDIVDEKNLYNEFDALSKKNLNYIQSVLLISAIVCALSCLGIYISMTKRYFAHGFIAGILITFLLATRFVGAYLHPVYSPMIIILLLISIYFLAKTRFCDYNENKLTGIFK